MKAPLTKAPHAEASQSFEGELQNARDALARAARALQTRPELSASALVYVADVEQDLAELQTALDRRGAGGSASPRVDWLLKTRRAKFAPFAVLKLSKRSYVTIQRVGTVGHGPDCAHQHFDVATSKLTYSDATDATCELGRTGRSKHKLKD